MINDVIQAERDQEADCALIDHAIHRAEANLAAPGRSQETCEHWSRIRDRTILTMHDVRRNVIERANAARETLKEMTEAIFRANGIKAPPGYSETLQDIPTTRLLHHLQYLIRTGELHRVRGVCDALEKRLDRYSLPSVFEEVLAQCILSDSEGESGKRLARICRLAKEADAKLAGLWFRRHWPEPGNGIAQDCAGERQVNAAAVDGVDISDRDFEGLIDADQGFPLAPPAQAEGDITTTETRDHLQMT